MKKLILSILIFFSIFLLSCTISNPFGTSTKKSTDVDVYVGFQGLIAEFSKTAPPPTVFQESSFPIFIRLRNVGAYDIKDKNGGKNGIISLGLEKDYVKDVTIEPDPRLAFDSNTLKFDIDGKSQINAKGDEIFVNFNAKTKKLDPQSETHTSAITATLCYPYQTLAAATVCIDPDPSGTRPGKKVCQVQDITFSRGQGAPITVVKIEPQMVPDGRDIKPQFLIYVENRGAGDVVNKDSYDNICTQSESSGSDVWNRAHIQVFTTGSQGENQLVCCPNDVNGNCDEKETDTNKKTGILRFRDKKDFVRCTFSNGIPRNYDAYTSPLKILIDYGYVQSISTNIIIQKPLKY